MSKIRRKVTVEKSGVSESSASEKRKPSVFERLGPGGSRRGYREEEDDPSDRASSNQGERCRHWIKTGSCMYGSKCKFLHGSASYRSRREESPEDLRHKMKPRKEKSRDRQRSESESPDMPERHGSPEVRSSRRDKESKIKSTVVVKTSQMSDSSSDSDRGPGEFNEGMLDFEQELTLMKRRQELQRELRQLREQEQLEERENVLINVEKSESFVSSSSESDSDHGKAKRKFKEQKIKKISKASSSERSPKKKVKDKKKAKSSKILPVPTSTKSRHRSRSSSEERVRANKRNSSNESAKEFHKKDKKLKYVLSPGLQMPDHSRSKQSSSPERKSGKAISSRKQKGRHPSFSPEPKKIKKQSKTPPEKEYVDVGKMKASYKSSEDKVFDYGRGEERLKAPERLRESSRFHDERYQDTAPVKSRSERIAQYPSDVRQNTDRESRVTKERDLSLTDRGWKKDQRRRHKDEDSNSSTDRSKVKEKMKRALPVAVSKKKYEESSSSESDSDSDSSDESSSDSDYPAAKTAKPVTRERQLSPPRKSSKDTARYKVQSSRESGKQRGYESADDRDYDDQDKYARADKGCTVMGSERQRMNKSPSRKRVYEEKPKDRRTLLREEDVQDRTRSRKQLSSSEDYSGRTRREKDYEERDRRPQASTSPERLDRGSDKLQYVGKKEKIRTDDARGRRVSPDPRSERDKYRSTAQSPDRRSYQSSEDRGRLSDERVRYSDDRSRSGDDRGRGRDDRSRTLDDRGRVIDDRGKLIDDRGRMDERGRVSDERGSERSRTSDDRVRSDDRMRGTDDRGRMTDDRSRTEERGRRVNDRSKGSDKGYGRIRDSEQYRDERGRGSNRREDERSRGGECGIDRHEDDRSRGRDCSMDKGRDRDDERIKVDKKQERNHDRVRDAVDNRSEIRTSPHRDLNRMRRNASPGPIAWRDQMEMGKPEPQGQPSVEDLRQRRQPSPALTPRERFERERRSPGLAAGFMDIMPEPMWPSMREIVPVRGQERYNPDDPYRRSPNMMDSGGRPRGNDRSSRRGDWEQTQERANSRGFRNRRDNIPVDDDCHGDKYRDAGSRHERSERYEDAVDPGVNKFGDPLGPSGYPKWDNRRPPDRYDERRGGRPDDRGKDRGDTDRRMQDRDRYQDERAQPEGGDDRYGDRKDYRKRARDSDRSVSPGHKRRRDGSPTESIQSARSSDLRDRGRDRDRGRSRHEEGRDVERPRPPLDEETKFKTDRYMAELAKRKRSASPPPVARERDPGDEERDKKKARASDDKQPGAEDEAHQSSAAFSDSVWSDDDDEILTKSEEKKVPATEDVSAIPRQVRERHHRSSSLSSIGSRKSHKTDRHEKGQERVQSDERRAHEPGQDSAPTGDGASQVIATLSDNDEDDRNKSAPDIEYDPISDDELDELIANEESGGEQGDDPAETKKTAIVDALDIDWASLVKDTQPKSLSTGSALKRFSPASVFARLGVSKAFAGEAMFSKVKQRCQEMLEEEAKSNPVKTEEGESPKPVDVPKFEFYHEMAFKHINERKKQKERANLLSNLGPYRRALCARRDLYIRRQLCKVEKNQDHALIDNVQIDPDLVKLGHQLMKQAKEARYKELMGAPITEVLCQT